MLAALDFKAINNISRNQKTILRGVIFNEKLKVEEEIETLEEPLSP